MTAAEADDDAFIANEDVARSQNGALRRVAGDASICELHYAMDPRINVLHQAYGRDEASGAEI